MLFSGDERFHESVSSCDTDADFMPQVSLLSSHGGARMQEPWFQGPAPDSSPSSPIPYSATTTLTTLTALDLVKPRQPSFSFGKSPRDRPHSNTQSHLHTHVLPPAPTASTVERSQSPVKYFGSSARTQVKPPVSYTPSISIESADRAFQHLLPGPTVHKFAGSKRQQKLKPSTTPGPGQYKPALGTCTRAPTLKSRTKMVGHNAGEDSPGPSSYSIPSSLVKKSHNIRSNGFGTENSGAPGKSRTRDQSHTTEQGKTPHPPSRTHSKPSAQPISSRNRTIFEASNFIAQNSKTDAIVMQEHFSKQHVKDARKLFQSMLSRSSEIIENTRKQYSGDDNTALMTSEVQVGREERVETEDKTNPPQVELVMTEKDDSPNKYAVGDCILGNFSSNGQWCPGKITRSATGGIYDILYDDGDKEDDRPESAIMSLPSTANNDSLFKVGDLIFGNYDNVGIWFEGEVTMCVQEDNSENGSILLYDVEYCDGDVEYGIPGSCLMPRR